MGAVCTVWGAWWARILARNAGTRGGSAMPGLGVVTTKRRTLKKGSSDCDESTDPKWVYDTTSHRGRRWSVGYSASAIPRGCLEPRIIRWRARGRETRGLGPSMTSLCIAKPAHSLRPRRPPADVTIALEKDPISIVQHHSPHRRHINTHFKNHAQPHTAMPRPSRMFLQVDCC